jgi:hypothetical protein
MSSDPIVKQTAADFVQLHTDAGVDPNSEVVKSDLEKLKEGLNKLNANPDIPDEIKQSLNGSFQAMNQQGLESWSQVPFSPYNW